MDSIPAHLIDFLITFGLRSIEESHLNVETKGIFKKQEVVEMVSKQPGYVPIQTIAHHINNFYLQLKKGPYDPKNENTLARMHGSAALAYLASTLGQNAGWDMWVQEGVNQWSKLPQIQQTGVVLSLDSLKQWYNLLTLAPQLGTGSN